MMGLSEVQYVIWCDPCIQIVYGTQVNLSDMESLTSAYIHFRVLQINHFLSAPLRRQGSVWGFFFLTRTANIHFTTLQK